MPIHGSCVAHQGEAVLILGPPGSGKSDLVLRLLDRPGWTLVADDQVELRTENGEVTAAPPPALAGMLEVRGVGLFRDLPVAAPARLRLVVDLVPRAEVPRLPVPAAYLPTAGAGEGRGAATVRLPRLSLHPFDASAPAKLDRALAAATGRARLEAGAFAA